MSDAQPRGLRTATDFQMYSLEKIEPRSRNARKHSKKQIRQIARSIEAFGFNNPILLDGDGVIVCGHGRFEAAKFLGLKEVPIVRLDHLTLDQARAYVIADNRLAEKSGWDNELLALELGELAELDLDLQLTGFDTAEIDVLLSPMLDDEEQPAEPDLKNPPVSRLGDLWELGPHRLLCGDSTAAESYQKLLGDERAQMVFTDPPYNVRIEGNVTSGDRHGEFVMASGEMTKDEFAAFLSTIFGHLAHFSVDGSIHFVCMDWRHMAEMHAAAAGRYAEFKNLCVWNKANAGMGSLYRSKHELVFVFKAGTAPHINNVLLGKHGRYRSNVWNYAGATSMSKGRAARLEMHPTVKPVVMIADAIKDCSNRDGLVLDPFGGSGSTLIAAHDTGRRAALVEMDPKYVDVIIKRYLRVGGQAKLAGSDQSWVEVEAARAGEASDV